MSIDTTLLKQVLAWVVSGGGAMVIAYFLMEKVPVLANLSAEYKRYVSIAIASLLGSLALWATMAMGYYPEPASTRGWIETMFAVAFVSSGGAQVIHGRVKLRNR